MISRTTLLCGVRLGLFSLAAVAGMANFGWAQLGQVVILTDRDYSDNLTTTSTYVQSFIIAGTGISSVTVTPPNDAPILASARHRRRRSQFRVGQPFRQLVAELGNRLSARPLHAQHRLQQWKSAGNENPALRPHNAIQLCDADFAASPCHMRVLRFADVRLEPRARARAVAGLRNHRSHRFL